MVLSSALFVLAALAAPTLAGTCATCPPAVYDTVTSLDGQNTTTTTYELVAHSNSGIGSPTFCGYSDGSSASFQYYCFYSAGLNSSNVGYISNRSIKPGCPPTSTVEYCTHVNKRQ